MELNDLKVGVNPIILNGKGLILLGRRLKKVGYGTYGLPFYIQSQIHFTLSISNNV